MNSANRLGLKTVGITITLLAVGIGLLWSIGALLAPTEQPLTTFGEQPSEAVIEPADQDGDQLPDAFEQHYLTDPTNPDTDGDGTPDFAELEAGRNPTVPGPNDSIAPPTGSQAADVSTLTGEYLASLPEDIAREDILRQETIEQFVELNRGELLPPLAAGVLKTNEAAGPETITAYLDAISASHNEQLSAVTNDDIAQALIARLQDDSQALRQLVTNLEHNIDTLAGIVAPAEAADLHQQLLQATQALLDNIRLLVAIDRDFIGGLIAARNIDDLGAIFLSSAEQVQALEEKYDISG